ncbi:unnamed protein product [Caenorhabditis angaria]|uniref:Exonuclease domain-containing protein n=1 Tax=Caenorhabditis angaria TaxID=860376 RepID=A0A9P1IRF8_9PELO|nr:unnamed protein product [Caenorhabditis angaria]
MNTIARRYLASKRGSFVEDIRIVKSREVKTPPKYPIFRKPSKKAMEIRQNFDYLLVLDFEATCEPGPIYPVQEIIEFPVVQLKTSNWQEIRRFHKYVKPSENPKISTFCTNLTGIIQEMIDGQENLEEVLKSFDDWIKEDDDLTNFAMVTCGDWDLKVALPLEAEYKQLEIPEYLKNWINVKKAYAEHTGHFARSMKHLLEIYQLKFEGRHHSGIDDVTNICEIVKCLGKSGHNFNFTSNQVQQRSFN